MKNLRITVRVEEPDRKKIESLVQKGKYKNLSHVIRSALIDFLNKEGD